MKTINLLFLFLYFGISTNAFALRVKEEQVILDELKDYQLCQTRDYVGTWCDDALKRWVKDHPADAFKAGKMTRVAMNSWVAIPFFSQAFEQKQGDCKDNDVKLAVYSALDLPKSGNDEILSSAKKIAFELCFSELKEEMASKAGIGSYFFENACKGLMAKGQLQGLKKKKCEELK